MGRPKPLEVSTTENVALRKRLHDKEWAVISPLLAPATKVGRPRRHRALDL
jgi:transposase